MSDSATGGYLLPDPDGPQPLQGDPFLDFMQAVVVGVLGIDGRLVRPRWQPETPNLPAANESWVALGVVDTDSDTFAVELHDPEDDGSSELQRHEVKELLASFYGPLADSYAALLRDGLQIAQNREVFQRNAVALVDTGRAIAAPVLTKNVWQNRIDMRVTVRRQIRRVYRVFNLLSANGVIYNEHYETPINVTETVSP
jgi:hypothetical protein